MSRSNLASIASLMIACYVLAPPSSQARQADGTSIDELRVLVDAGRYAEAIAAARERLALVEAASGNSLELARILDVLVESLWRGGKARDADTLSYAERAVSLKEEIFGPMHAELAKSLDNLGVVLLLTGEYPGARQALERAVTVGEAALPPGDPALATFLNHLAPVLQNIGAYSEARPLYERALAIQEAALGPEHSDVGKTLNNLATLLKDMGDYTAALPLYRRSLAIVERDLGPEHPLVGIGQSNLGELLQRLGSYAEAQSLYERSLAVKEQTLGENHPSLATTLNNLGELYSIRGDVDAAKPLYERAMAIQVEALGPDHPDVALSLANLAGWFLRAGEADEARSRYERALAIREAALGPEHPLVADVLFKLAFAYQANGLKERAFVTTLDAESVSREHLRLTSRALPERQALTYASARISGLDLALSLVAEEPSDERPERVWDALVRSRAIVLDEMAARHRTLSESEEPQMKQAADDYRLASERLANLVVRGPAGRPPAQYRESLRRARNDRERAERLLAERSVSFGQTVDQRRLGLTDVLDALPERSALVGYVRYRHYGRGTAGTPSYLAFVVSKDDPSPRVVDLGAAAAIEDAVRVWRNEVIHGSSFPGRSARQSEEAAWEAGARLRNRIWDPIPETVRNARYVFIVPDGALHLASVAALPGEDGKYLVEGRTVHHYLSAERDLAITGAKRDEGFRSLLVLGGADFAAESSYAGRRREPSIVESIGEMLSEFSVFRGVTADCDAFRTKTFEPLPGSAREADAIAALWRRHRSENGSRFQKLSGESANEAAVKALASEYEVLHFATHGFFLGGGCASLLSTESQETPPQLRANPLTLSGLALAGANHRGTAGAGEEDGILTAEEIGSLDLSRVEWVVLSGCDTGVGELRTGEGVLGLRRAFRVAGAGTLVMSLWPVEDDATRRWMTALYRARLENGLDTARSVSEASRSILRELRNAGESTHPVHWGAFVATGSWN